MPYKINPFTGNPDYYDASTGGTVTSITAGNGLNGGTITTSGTIDIDGTKVPYYALGPSAGLVQWNGSAWVIDATNYVDRAGDTMTGYLTLNADPTLALHAATKQYVDNLASGINFHAPVVAATTAPLPSVTYSNGVAGVGATLIATAPGALTIDTVSFIGGERVLIKDQTSQLENGIYVVNVPGDGSTPFQLTRATDADNSPSGELTFGDFCFVEQGPTNGGFGYILNTTGTIVVGTDPINYVIFNAAQVVTAGTGLTELPTNTLNIDTLKVPYYSGGFVSTGLAKWDGLNWSFDNSTYLDTITAASTYLTQANAAATYYPLTNPAGYITSASLSGYVPYTLATNNVDLGAFQLSTSQLNISTKGTISSSGTNTLLVNNTATDGTTKVQFNGTDILELKGASSVSTITNFRYTNPNNTNQSGPISSMIIDPGTKEWPDATAPNAPGDIQKEIEILSPNYTVTYPGPPGTWDGTPITLYVNAPTTNTTGVGYSLGLYGHFKLEGDATDYPGGTYLDIGSGDGTTIGFTGAKLSFFGNPPIVQPTGITTVQGLSTALSNLGLIATSTLSFGTTGSVLFAGVSGALSQDNANFFWDDTNNRLGIGTSTPTERLNVSGGNLLLTMALGGYLKMYDQAGIIHNIESNQALVLQTTTSYINLKAGSSGSISFATNGSSTQLLILNSSNAVGNSIRQFTFNPYAQSGLLASTEVNTVIWNGASKTWQTGNITIQREHYIKSSTLNFAVASTITDAYGLYAEAPTAGTNATITNNYALGVKGQVGLEWTSGGATMIIGDWGTFSTYGWGIITSNNLFRLPTTLYIGDTNFTIRRASTTGIIEPFNNITLQSGNTTGGQKTYLAGIQSTGHVGIGTLTPTERLTISGGNVLIEDAGNIVVGSTTGTKIGTATTQKLGFFNATPIVQPGPVTDAQGIADALTSLGLIDSSTIQVQEVIQAACSDETTAITVGTAKVTFRMPYAMTLIGVRASLSVAQTSNGAGGIFTVDINESGVSILSTKLTIDNTQRTSTTATVPAVISDSSLADDAEITVDIDQIGDGTAKGLKVTLIGYRT